MAHTQSVAVIIVNWNSEALLYECLTHLRQQTRAPNRVIVFDNSGNDGSLDQARQVLPSIECLSSGENVGFARANNLCVERCGDCQWICLLNPDAFPSPGWLDALLRAAERYPRYDNFASLIVQQRDPGLIDSAGDRYYPSGVAVHRFYGRLLEEVSEMVAAPYAVFAPCAAAAMYRRESFLETGGFDESLFAFYEDVDLGLRLQLAGRKTLFVPDALVHHVGGGTTGGVGSRISAYYCQRNFILVYAKNMPASLFWLGLPAHVWAIIRGILKGSLERQGLLLLKATLDALVRLPACFLSRRALRPLRRVPVEHFRASLSSGGSPTA